jgi:hypothetical protein
MCSPAGRGKPLRSPLARSNFRRQHRSRIPEGESATPKEVRGAIIREVGVWVVRILAVMRYLPKLILGGKIVVIVSFGAYTHRLG